MSSESIPDIVREYRNRLNRFYTASETEKIISLVFEKFVGGNNPVYSTPGKMVTADERNALDSALARLEKNEPLQYVLGETWFMGLKIFVNDGVLIPRPETEELVEWVTAGALSPSNILDACTGSGCIALALKRHYATATVVAFDESESALDVARKNAAFHGSDIRFFRHDLLSASLREGERYDLVVSNPPYISREEAGTLAPSVRDFEPDTALFVPGDDPLIFYKALARLSAQHLLPGGALYVEINQAYGKEVCQILEQSGLVATLKKDMSGNDRMVSGILR